MEKNTPEPDMTKNAPKKIHLKHTIVGYAVCDGKEHKPFIAGDTGRFYIYAKRKDAAAKIGKEEVVVPVRIQTYE